MIRFAKDIKASGDLSQLTSGFTGLKTQSRCTDSLEADLAMVRQTAEQWSARGADVNITVRVRIRLMKRSRNRYCGGTPREACNGVPL